MGLHTQADFFDFVDRDFMFYSTQFERILQVTTSSFDSSSPLRFIRYNHDLGFTLQHQLLLAPLRRDDAPAVIDHKLELVGRYVDILLAWRIWNFRSTARPSRGICSAMPARGMNRTRETASRRISCACS